MSGGCCRRCSRKDSSPRWRRSAASWMSRCRWAIPPRASCWRAARRAGVQARRPRRLERPPRRGRLRRPPISAPGSRRTSRSIRPPSPCSARSPCRASGSRSSTSARRRLVIGLGLIGQITRRAAQRPGLPRLRHGPGRRASCELALKMGALKAAPRAVRRRTSPRSRAASAWTPCSSPPRRNPTSPSSWPARPSARRAASCWSAWSG